MAIDVFISYSHLDEALYTQLAKHLKPLEYEGLIRAWYDRQLLPGNDFETEISGKLEAARVILLLISPDFVDSEYCWGKEMKVAMERHDSGSAYVVPIILRPVDWQGAPFGRLVALPKDGKPITTWANQDEAFFDIAHRLRPLITQLNSPSPQAAAAPPMQQAVLPVQPPEEEVVAATVPTAAPSPAVATSVATVHLTRDSAWSNKLRNYKVTVDGNKIGLVGDGETFSFTLPVGRHQLRLGVDFYGSNTLDLELRAGEHAYLECGNNSSLKGLTSPGSYLWVKRVYGPGNS